jgi:hypothetical protein
LPQLLIRNRASLASLPTHERASFIMGDTPILMMMCADDDGAQRVDELAALIENNWDHPARELMWGAPGTLLAALLLYRRTAHVRWSDLFVRTAAKLRSHLKWSDEFQCHYWTQELYGQTSTYLDAIHGFVGTAAVLIRGRDLLEQHEWHEWCELIIQTVERTATRESGMANWRPQLLQGADAKPSLMQFCHGSPGFVICLADVPDARLDQLLIEAGEAIWRAGPLRKGNNLCHGTAGNGYAFLKLYERTGDNEWLNRARAFAMHGIDQLQRAQREFGRLRHSLWTGDPGFAIYLRDCIRTQAKFPTLDVFWSDVSHLTRSSINCERSSA